MFNSNLNSAAFPYLGHGIGLRPIHYQAILETKPKLDWLEVMTEDYLNIGGRPLHYLHQIREHYPIVMHGVSLSIGSSDAVNLDYLQQLKNLAHELQPKWISDHLCWTGINHLNMHDLLPLPYTEEAIKHLVAKVKQVQDFLGRQILLENVSSYITYKHSVMPEWEFLNSIAEQADCYLLLDINNIYVSAFNHDFKPEEFLLNIHQHRVKQFHLAGHQQFDTYIIDTHDQPIVDPVWNLYAQALKHFGKISTLIERDGNIPPLVELLTEVKKARHIANTIFCEAIA